MNENPLHGRGKGETTRLPRMCPGSSSQIQCHMLVDSLLCTESFSPGTPDFPSPQKPTFDLICVNLSISFTVSPVRPPAIDRLDT